jgi:hypothetical protein
MVTMALGLLLWITGFSIVGFHITFGVTGVLGLLTLGLVAFLTSGMRTLGVVSVLYAFFVPAFGLTQITILMGGLHWLIQVAHLLVGIGAMVLAQQIDKRYQRRRKPAAGSQATLMQTGRS